MRPVWFRFRAEVRSRWRAVVSLMLLTGLGGGFVFAAAAGARETDTAYPRFIDRIEAADAFLPNTGGFFGFATLDFDIVEKLPQVSRSARVEYFALRIDLPNGRTLTPVTGNNEVVVLASDDPRYARDLNRIQIVDGRAASSSSATEAVVSHDTARRYGIAVGDVMKLTHLRYEDLAMFPTFDPTGPKVDVTVVGIGMSGGDAEPSAGFPLIQGTRAFHDRFKQNAVAFPALMVRLHRRDLMDEFKAQLATDAVIPEPSGGTKPSFVIDIPAHTAIIQRSIHTQAVALWFLAGLAGIAALSMLSQAIARHGYVESTDNPNLAAIGMTRTQLFVIGLARAAIVGAGGAVVAVVVAIALSPLTPIGLARVIEVDVGLSADLLVFGVGSLSLVALVVGAAAWPAWRAASALERASLSRLIERQRTSRASAAAVRLNLRPAAVAGIQMALDPGRGRAALPVRSAIVGAVIGLVSVVSAFSVGASLDHLLRTPSAYGWRWDAILGDSFQPDLGGYSEGLIADERVAAVGIGSALQIGIGPVQEDALAFDALRGDVAPTILEGRPPTANDEILLGTKTLQAAGVGVGDVVPVRLGSKQVHMTVVGRAVFPALTEKGGLGRGAMMTFEGMLRLAPSTARNQYVVRFVAGLDKEATQRDFRADFGANGMTVPKPPTDLVNFGRVEGLPYLLGGLMGLLAIGTLAHTLVSGVRRRRRDLAVFKTLGFSRGQVRAAVAWQATTIIAIALLIGVPLGMAAGRWLWSVIASELGVAPVPIVPLALVLTVIPGGLVLANAIAAAPGEVAARTQPATALRSE